MKQNLVFTETLAACGVAINVTTNYKLRLVGIHKMGVM
jgi:hypothetical protein